MIEIDVAKAYTKYTGGRYTNDCPKGRDGSAEGFRDTILIPAIEKHGLPITLDFSGVMGVGSPWVEECFGGLVRLRKIVLSDMRKIILKGLPESREAQVYEYMSDQFERNLKAALTDNYALH